MNEELKQKLTERFEAISAKAECDNEVRDALLKAYLAGGEYGYQYAQTHPNWQQVRIQAAIAAMQGMLANPQTFEQIDHDKGYKEVCDGDKTKIVARASVMYADALVAELKRSEDVYAECRRMDAINTASVCENMTKIQKELQKKGGEQ